MCRADRAWASGFSRSRRQNELRGGLSAERQAGNRTLCASWWASCRAGCIALISWMDRGRIDRQTRPFNRSVLSTLRIGGIDRRCEADASPRRRGRRAGASSLRSLCRTPGDDADALGQRGTLAAFQLAMGAKMIAALARRPPAALPDLSPRSPLEEILNAARWAPSGDNAQPWRFEVRGESGDRAFGGAGCAQDLSISRRRVRRCWRVARCWRVYGSRRVRGAGGWSGTLKRWINRPRKQRITVDFMPADDVEPDRLFSQLHLRSVNRRAYRARRLTVAEKSALAQTLGDELTIDWLKSTGSRWNIARLGGLATDIRLRSPEAFVVHRQVIDWARPFSPDGLPARGHRSREGEPAIDELGDEGLVADAAHQSGNGYFFTESSA